jgi:hypothetical protein
LYLASSERNCEGIELGNTTSHAGRRSSAPGIMMKSENGINLMKSLFTCLSLISSEYDSLSYFVS